jgi:competence protein ComEA
MPSERRAVLLVLALAVAGQGLRLWINRPGTPPGDINLIGADPLARPDAHRDSSLAAARPLGPGERIDLDRAPAAELIRLPGVGLGLARRIVADREAHGNFGNLEAVDRVPGVGPRLLASLTDVVRFSTLPSAKPVTSTLVDLNAATAEQLERVPYLGPHMAAQIVADRNRHGPFPVLDSLVRVPGVGPATVERIRKFVRVE